MVSLRLAAALSFLAFSGTATAQDKVQSADLPRDIEIARTAATEAAETLSKGLPALIPSVPGWTCDENKTQTGMISLAEFPSVRFTCEHEQHSLAVTLLYDPSSAELLCQSIANDRQGIEDGRIKPDLFRFFDGGQWQIVRSSLNLKGCTNNAIALLAKAKVTEDTLAHGPAAIDAFAEAFLDSDPSAVMAKTNNYTEAVTTFVSKLYTQSRLLADLIPAPPGAESAITLPASAATARLPLPMVIAASPSVSAQIKLDSCTIMIELSASPTAIHEARSTGSRWAAHGRANGTRYGAFIARITDRLVGLERQDGTGIEALVDDALIVRVVIIGNLACKEDPDIVNRLFEEVLAKDPAAIVRP